MSINVFDITLDPDVKRHLIEQSDCQCGHAKTVHVTENLDGFSGVVYGKCDGKVVVEATGEEKQCSCKKWVASLLDCGWADEGIPMLGGAKDTASIPAVASAAGAAAVAESAEKAMPLPQEVIAATRGGSSTGGEEDDALIRKRVKELFEADRVQRELKVLFLSSSGIMRKFERSIIRGAGLDNWRRVLGADMLTVKELGDNPRKTLENYELIHVNLSNEDSGLVTKCFQWLGSGSSTKVMANNDYAVETLQTVRRTANLNLRSYIKDVLLADYLIAQEPFEYELFRVLLDQYKDTALTEGKLNAHIPKLGFISHPIHTAKVKGLAYPVDHRQPVLGVMFHKYDDHVDLPALLCRNLPDRSWFNDQPLARFLFGYTDKFNLFEGDNYFDGVLNEIQWPQYVQHYAASVVGLEYYTISSHSRNAAESACLRIPLVCTEHSYNGRQLFPEICHPHWKLTMLRESLHKVITDEEYWYKVVDLAYDKVEDFNYQNSWYKLRQLLSLD